MIKNVLRNALLCLTLVAVVVACDEFADPGGGGALIPTDIVVASGGSQTGEVGLDLPESVVVRVVDAGGTPIPGMVVEWAVAGGGGSVTGETTTSSDGTASGTWTLGETAGGQSITISMPDATGVASLTVTATAEPGPVATLTAAPDTVRLEALEETGTFTAAAEDRFGNAVGGFEASWSSSDETVATVDAAGTVTARGNGTAEIMITAADAMVTATVVVEQAPVAVTIGAVPGPLTAIGDTMTVTATVDDANGFAVEGETITWSSLDAATISVDGAGLLTANAAGSAEIVAASGSLADTVTVAVDQQLATVVVSPVADTIDIGATATFGAAAFDANDAAVAGVTFTWTALDPSIATVDASGVATGVAEGEARIMVAAEGVSDTAKLVVVGVVPDSVVVSPDSAALASIGATTTLMATAWLGGSQLASPTFTWSSSDAAIASVDAGGVVTAEAEGTAWVRASSGGVTDSAKIVVDVAAAPAGITISPDQDTVGVDGLVTFSAEVVDTDGAVVAGADVVFSSLDPTIASVVDTTGVATGLAEGSARIVASYDVFADTATLLVEGVAADSVDVTPASVALTFVGDTAHVSATAYDETGAPMTGQSFDWTSGDATVATVVNGVVTAEGVGTAWVFAASGAGKDSVEVVVAQEPASISIVSGDNQEGSAGAELPDSLVVEVRDGGGSVVAGVDVAWATSDGSIVPATAMTGAGGHAKAAWTMPSAIGAYTATATVADSLVATFNASVGSIPGAEACGSAGTSHELDITANETWAAAGSPHHVSGIITVSNDATLTIEPGSLLCMGNAAQIETAGRGRIVALGTATDSIVMTATNIGQPWWGLRLRTTSADTSRFAHVTIEYADAPIDAQGAYTVYAEDMRVRQSGIVVLHGNGSELVRTTIDTTTNNVAIDTRGDGVLLQDVTVRAAMQMGIYVEGDNTTLQRVAIHDAGTEGLRFHGGARGSVLDSVKVVNSGTTGLHAPPHVIESASGFRVTGSGEYGARLGIDVIPVLAPTPADQDSLLGNARDTLAVIGGAMYTDSVTVRADLPWRVETTTTVDTLSLLTVEPGAWLGFNGGARLNFANGGHVSALGTAGNWITMTSLAAATLSDPYPTPWGGLNMTAPTWTSARSELRYTLIEHSSSYPVWTGGTHTVSLDSVRIRQSGLVFLSSGDEQLNRVAIDTSRYATQQALYLSHTDSVVLNEVVVRAAPNRGVDLYNADEATLTNLRIVDSGAEGLRLLGGTQGTDLTDVRVEGSDSIGFVADPNSVESASGVRVIGGGSYGARIGADVLARIAPSPADQDSLMANARDTLVISGGRVDRDSLTVRADFPWRVEGSVTVDTLSLLTVEPGAWLGFNNGQRLTFTNGGRLSAIGTAGNWIRMTTTAEPTLSDPYPSPWGGLHMQGPAWTSARSELRYTLIEHSNNYPVWTSGTHTVSLDSVRIRHSGLVFLSSGDERLNRVAIDSSRYATGQAVYVSHSDSAVLNDVVVRAAPANGIDLYNADEATLTNVRILDSGAEGLRLIGGTQGVDLTDVRVAGSGGEGLVANPNSVESAAGVRVLGSGSYGARIGADVLARIATLPAAQDSLMGNARDTLVVTGGTLYFDSVTVRDDFPWRVEGSVNVDTLSLLTVQPGAWLGYANGQRLTFTNGGRLSAVGTPGNWITMTTLAEPTLSDPYPTPWGGLHMNAPNWTSATSQIEYALLEHVRSYPIWAHGQHRVHVDSVRFRQSGMVFLTATGSRLERVVVDTARYAPTEGAILVAGDSITLTDVVVRGSATNGIYAAGNYTGLGAGTLSNVRIYDAAQVGLLLSSYNTRVKLYDVRIEGSGQEGLVAPGATIEDASGVRVVGNGSYGAKIGVDLLPRLAPTPADQDSLMGNAIDTLVVTGGRMYFDTTTVRADFPWRVEAALNFDSVSHLAVNPGAHLALRPSVRLNFSNGARMVARGTADSLITFTTTETGSVAQPLPTKWGGFYFNSSFRADTSVIANAVIEHAGYTSAWTAHAIHMDSVHVRHADGFQFYAPAEIRHSAFDSSGTATYAAVHLYSDAENDTLRVTNTVIRGAIGIGLYTDYSYSSTDMKRQIYVGNVEITGSGSHGWDMHGAVMGNNNIYDNAGLGVSWTLDNPSSSTGTYDWASPVWWGDTGGPDAANGDGAEFTNSGWTLNVTSWLTSPVTITDNPWAP